MSYKKEISFLMRNPHQIIHALIGKYSESEGDYDYADERFHSSMTSRTCEIMTNHGLISFESCDMHTKYESYYGEENRWVNNEKKAKKSHSVTIGGSDFLLDKSSSDTFNKFLDKAEKQGVVLKGKGFADCKEKMNNYLMSADKQDEAARQNGEVPTISRVVVVTTPCLPDLLLDNVLEANKSAFEGLSINKLKELNQALNNTSRPKDFLERLSAMSDSAQVGAVYYAMKKSEFEVDRLLFRKHELNHGDEMYM